MAINGTAPTRDIGHIDISDLYGQQWIDQLERVPDLMWPLSVQTYAQMRRDPKLASILRAYSLPIRRATWALDPAGCRDEVVNLVADDLGLPVVGDDSAPGPARRRGVVWAEHVRMALLSLTYGHMPFERRYEIRGGRARLVNLGERMPWTVRDIGLNRDGTIRDIVQDVGGSRPIAANRLVWYAHEREGSTWTGQSTLRPAFGPWLLKHELWRVHATSIRRFGMGVPNVEAPPGGSPVQVAEAQRLASAMRVGDQSGAGLPSGFKLNITGMTGTVPDALEFIRYFDQQMSTMALAGMLDLGQTETGSRALGDTFLELFLLSLQAVADEIAAVATSGQPGLTGIVTDIVDLNWGEDEPAPRVVATDVGDRHEVTAEAIGQLITSGVLTPDSALEAFVRDMWGLPERAEKAPAALPAAPAKPELPAAAAKPRRRRSKKHDVRAAGDPVAGNRQMTTVEAASGMDPDAVQGDWQSALDALVEDWETLAAAQREELVAQITAKVDDGDVTGLAEMTATSTATSAVLATAMQDVADTSAQRVVAEAAAQGVTIEPAPAVDAERLGALAAAVAAIAALGLAGAAGREALRVWTPGRTGSDVSALVDEHLEGLSDAYLREQLGGALSTAQNTGRIAAMEAAPAASYHSSEILDTNTCAACAAVDGSAFADLAAAAEAYASGGYVACAGRLRCRGLVIAVWNP